MPAHTESNPPPLAEFATFVTGIIIVLVEEYGMKPAC